MATSEARKRANANYIKRSIVQKGIGFSPVDADLIEWFQSKEEPFGTYVKRLIREDMERHKGKNKE